MLEIGSRYKTGYLFLSLSASLCCSSYKLLCCWRHTRRILNTIESNSSNSFTPSFLILSTTAVNRSHWLFDHSIALIAHGDTFSRE